MIREVHVYGKVAALHRTGEGTQHLGLGRALVEEACAQAAAAGYTAINVISAVGTRFERGDYFIADLIVSGMIYRSALNEREPLRSGGAPRPLGKVVIGVVAGDIHDIGKDIIVSLLRAERFDVVDLGIDVKPERFVHAVRNYHPDVVLLSGVLTTAQEAMVQTIQALTDAGLRDQVKVLIGGLCTSEYLMHHVGADGWAYDSNRTVRFCKEVVDGKEAAK